MNDGGGAIAGIVSMVIPLAISIFFIVASWKIFTKAGKPGWAIFVPIYNLVVMLEIAGKPIWWIVLFLIPVVNFFAGIVLCISLAKAFGKDTGFGIGLALLGFIFLPILAFGSAQYAGPQE